MCVCGNAFRLGLCRQFVHGVLQQTAPPIRTTLRVVLVIVVVVVVMVQMQIQACAMVCGCADRCIYCQLMQCDHSKNRENKRKREKEKEK